MSSQFSSYKTNAEADIPDLRDRMYEPRLLSLKSKIDPPMALRILDQGREGACTGFGLASVINGLLRQRNDDTCVSARMLYEMAKRYDEWAGTDYQGSSCRGAINGWKNMGVCSEQSWPNDLTTSGYVTVKRAKEARQHILGAYYRIRPEIVDFHSALNEVGVIYASATVHEGWQNPKEGRISFKKAVIGGHAFAIVGYNGKGFWVQNSWGEQWGKHGIALWSYEDWAHNITDAWVVQLALPTPQIFNSVVVGNMDQTSVKRDGGAIKVPPRSEICGHFVHLDDGKYCDQGRFWSNRNDVAETAKFLETTDKYDHFLFYAHGGLNTPELCAKRVAATKDIYKDNRIYPYHFMYDTGLIEEVEDVLVGKKSELEGKMGGFTDWWDRRVEMLSRKAGRALWREMKRGASKPFERTESDGSDVIFQLLHALNKNPHPIKLHLVGHSTGAILLAHLLNRLYQENSTSSFTIGSCSLFAPAATVKLYESHYLPFLVSRSIATMQVYNLSHTLEEDDNVVQIYRKSLLKLVSRAFEDSDHVPGNVPLLGLQEFSETITTTGMPLAFIYSHGDSIEDVRTKSKTHGGFDNDPATMNSVLKCILDKEPKRKFTPKDLNY